MTIYTHSHEWARKRWRDFWEQKCRNVWKEVFGRCRYKVSHDLHRSHAHFCETKLTHSRPGTPALKQPCLGPSLGDTALGFPPLFFLFTPHASLLLIALFFMGHPPFPFLSSFSTPQNTFLLSKSVGHGSASCSRGSNRGAWSLLRF